MPDRDRDAFGVDEFCRNHGISRGLLYALWRRGEGPQYFLVGDRRLVSCEAADRWRKAREAETTAAGAA